MNMTRPEKIALGPGQESMWDYPRPPRLESVGERLLVKYHGEIVADTAHGYRVLETRHPPAYYFPPDCVTRELLEVENDTSLCEFKGIARYWRLQVGNTVSPTAAWSYSKPAPPYALLEDYFAFYPSRTGGCWVDDEEVRAQAGNFYGGWITSRVVGTRKGEPGTRTW
jgi:uncharacterized protein (DUF427 family)